MVGPRGGAAARRGDDAAGRGGNFPNSENVDDWILANPALMADVPEWDNDEISRRTTQIPIYRRMPKPPQKRAIPVGILEEIVAHLTKQMKEKDPNVTETFAGINKFCQAFAETGLNDDTWYQLYCIVSAHDTDAKTEWRKFLKNRAIQAMARVVSLGKLGAGIPVPTCCRSPMLTAAMADPNLTTEGYHVTEERLDPVSFSSDPVAHDAFGAPRGLGYSLEVRAIDPKHTEMTTNPTRAIRSAEKKTNQAMEVLLAFMSAIGVPRKLMEATNLVEQALRRELDTQDWTNNPHVRELNLENDLLQRGKQVESMDFAVLCCLLLLPNEYWPAAWEQTEIKPFPPLRFQYYLGKVEKGKELRKLGRGRHSNLERDISMINEESDEFEDAVEQGSIIGEDEDEAERIGSYVPRGPRANKRRSQGNGGRRSRRDDSPIAMTLETAEEPQQDNMTEPRGGRMDGRSQGRGRRGQAPSGDEGTETDTGSYYDGRRRRGTPRHPIASGSNQARLNQRIDRHAPTSDEEQEEEYESDRTPRNSENSDDEPTDRRRAHFERSMSRGGRRRGQGERSQSAPQRHRFESTAVARSTSRDNDMEAVRDQTMLQMAQATARIAEQMNQGGGHGGRPRNNNGPFVMPEMDHILLVVPDNLPTWMREAYLTATWKKRFLALGEGANTPYKWRKGEPLPPLVRKKIQAALKGIPIEQYLRTGATHGDSSGRAAATANAVKQLPSLATTSSKTMADFIFALQDLYNNPDADTVTLDANIMMKLTGNSDAAEWFENWKNAPPQEREPFGISYFRKCQGPLTSSQVTTVMDKMPKDPTWDARRYGKELKRTIRPMIYRIADTNQRSGMEENMLTHFLSLAESNFSDKMVEIVGAVDLDDVLIALSAFYEARPGMIVAMQYEKVIQGLHMAYDEEEVHYVRQTPGGNKPFATSGGRGTGRNPLFGASAPAPRQQYLAKKTPEAPSAGNARAAPMGARLYRKCTFCPSRGHTRETCDFKDARDKRIPPGWQCFNCYAKGDHIGAVCPTKYPFAKHLTGFEICCKCKEPGHFTSQCQSDFPVDESRIAAVDAILEKCLKPTKEDIEAGNLKMEIAKQVMMMDLTEEEASYYGEMYADQDDDSIPKNEESGPTQE